MTSANPDTLPGYSLSRPTEELALRSLVRVFGEDQGRALWARACKVAGCPRPGPALSLPELRAVAVELERYPGLVAVLGAALRIRVDTFLSLAASLLARKDNEHRTLGY